MALLFVLAAIYGATAYFIGRYHERQDGMRWKEVNDELARLRKENADLHIKMRERAAKRRR